MSQPLLSHLYESSSSTSSPNITPPDHPTVFELLATEELRGLVEPAYRYVLAFFAQRYPRYLLRLINRHEEVYALLMTAVEGYHLWKFDTTFAEKFYSLRYTSTNPNTATASAKGKQKAVPTSGRLSRGQKLLTLLCIVGIPYLRAKLKDLYHRLGGGIDSEVLAARGEDEGDYRGSLLRSASTLKILLLKSFKIFYPFLNLLYTLVEVGYDLGYAFNLSPWAIRQAERLENGVGEGGGAVVRSGMGGLGWRWWMRGVGVRVVRDDGSLTDSLSPTTLLPSLLPTSLLLLKFSQWWYSPQSPRLQRGVAEEEKKRMKVPAPRMGLPARRGWSGLNLKKRRSSVKANEKAAAGKEEEKITEEDDDVSGDESDSDSGVEDNTSDNNEAPNSSACSSTSASSLLSTPPDLPYNPLPANTCPLCLQPWTNPTITPTGYVGCYLCLYRFVEREGKCPVTGVSLEGMGGVDGLRKVLI